MNLPSFLWLWRIAAWAMGLAIVTYLLLALSGGWMWWLRRTHQPRPDWLRPLHFLFGTVLVGLVILLLWIGVFGTIGEYGGLGQSWHLPIAIAVVDLVFISAWSAVQISPGQPWARRVHLTTNSVLLVGFVLVSLSGWQVVQKYLP